jgi:hypothetical protein
MKKIIPLILISFILITSAKSQSIVSFSVLPANPTNMDSIEVIIECMFPSGACDGTASLIGITGNEILVEAAHCMGMLSVICTDFDTIVLPPQPAGPYSFIFSLNTGSGFPCVPGSTPSDIDTVDFTISDVTNINPIKSGNNFEISQSPEGEKFIVKHSFNEPAELNIFSIEGRKIDNVELTLHETEVNKQLPAGVYIMVIEFKGKKYFSKKVVVE